MQGVCSQSECQRRRRAEYHRQKLQTDGEHQQVTRDSQKKWPQTHPDYLKQYRAQHPKAMARNRQRHQQQRDQKRRIRLLEKNNLNASDSLQSTEFSGPK